MTAAPVRPRGWLSGAGLSNLGCGAFAEPLRLGLAQSGIEQLGEMLAERMDFGPRGLGLGPGLGPGDLGPGADFRGAGMGGIWGNSGSGGKGKRRSFAALD